jgi:hypothetical protein
MTIRAALERSWRSKIDMVYGWGVGVLGCLGVGVVGRVLGERGFVLCVCRRSRPCACACAGVREDQKTLELKMSLGARGAARSVCSHESCSPDALAFHACSFWGSSAAESGLPDFEYFSR